MHFFGSFCVVFNRILPKMFEYGAFHFMNSIMMKGELANHYLEYILINSLAKHYKVGTGVA